MNRKGEDLLMDNAIYLILLVFYTMGMIYFVYQQNSGAGIWEDFYAKEIARVVNLAKPGDEFRLDIQKGSEIAKRNKVEDLEKIFIFDNEKKEICVKLNSGARRTCYNYYNNVNVIDLGVEFGIPSNVLKFKVSRSEVVK